MSRIVPAVGVVIAVLSMSGSFDRADAGEPPGVAVVELFTSEGCNSCPSADKVLQKWVEQQAKTKGPVYCLGFHVDYWDRLGWPDRFADRRFTERQQNYARILDSDRVYTPQMIVNGRVEFVGSNAKLADRAIAAAQAEAATVSLKLTAQRLDGGAWRVWYELEGDVKELKNVALNAALVETDLKTSVKRGENAGVTLRHANTVRAWKSVDLESSRPGDVDLTPPKDIRLDHCRVIVFVQDRATRRVLGANQTEVLSNDAPAVR